MKIAERIAAVRTVENANPSVKAEPKKQKGS